MRTTEPDPKDRSAAGAETLAHDATGATLLRDWTLPSPAALARAEDLERLGDRIVKLSAQIQVATYHLLVLIREFDERCGWNGGFKSCAHWLNWRTGLGFNAAREKVRVARALGDLPETAAAFRRAEISYSKVRALTRIATPDNEAELLYFATYASAAQTERLVRGWRRIDRLEEARRDQRRRSHRGLTAYWDEDGMLVIRGRLEPEVGAVFLRALEAASDRLHEAARTESPEQPSAKQPPRQEPPQEASMEAPRQPSPRPGTDTVLETVPVEHRRADALALVAEAALNADLDPGTRGDRYLVVTHVDKTTLQSSDRDGTTHPGMAMLDDAVDVSAETSRRLACDAAWVTMSHDAQGNVLDVGRKTRTIPPALRRALVFRDRTCRFPGCGARLCDGHHMEHWADGGETSLDNLILLCRRHHRMVHEEGYRVERDEGGAPRFFTPRGLELPQAPHVPCPADASPKVLEAVVAAAGVEVSGRTGSAANWGADFGMALSILRSRPAPVVCWAEPDVSAETWDDASDSNEPYRWVPPDTPWEWPDDGTFPGLD